MRNQTVVLDGPVTTRKRDPCRSLGSDLEEGTSMGIRTAARRRRGVRRWAVGAALALSLAGCQYDWSQFGGGPSHSGNNTLEDTITPENVASLHRLWQATLPAFADGAAAYAIDVVVGGTKKDLVVVTTRPGDVVALDAATGAQQWKASFGPGSCRINNGTQACYTTSSPAVADGFVYSYGLDGYLHKLALDSGTEVRTGGWPELVTRKGFDEKGSSQLTIATAADGTSYLYMTTAGYPGDRGDYQGHVVTVNLATGAQRVYNTLCSNQAVHFAASPGSPDCVEKQSGVWARAGVVYDSATDRILVSSGNGEFAPANHHWGDTVLSLHADGSPANANGDPIDSYTPANYATLDVTDADLGSTLPALLPPVAGSRVARLGVMSGKDGKLRLLNLDDLSGRGGPGSTGGEVGAIVNVPQGGQVLTQPAVWTDPTDDSVWVFVANGRGTSGFRVEAASDGTPALLRQWQTTVTGTSPMVANNVLYAAASGRVGAYDPRTGRTLWQDTALGTIHWQTPVVASGKLLVEDGAGHLTAYGV
jgi:outer membrane protein assembly factor BamB